MNNPICELCDERVKYAKKIDGIWVCEECDKLYPRDCR